MHKNKYHRDGTVTYWDVYQQRWMRLHAMLIKDRILATMNDAMRERIARHAEKHPQSGLGWEKQIDTISGKTRAQLYTDAGLRQGWA